MLDTQDKRRRHHQNKQLTGSRVHVLVPAPPHQLPQSPGPLLLEGRSSPPLDDALHELLAVEALERSPEAQHLPQDKAEAVNVRLRDEVKRRATVSGDERVMNTSHSFEGLTSRLSPRHVKHEA